jgi:hypothetical protein
VALQPIAQQFLNVTGAELVAGLPQEMLDWLLDTSVVIAARQGSITSEEALEYLKPICKCEPIVEKVIKPQPYERIVYNVSYVKVPVKVVVEKIVEKPYDVIEYRNRTVVTSERIVFEERPIEVYKDVYVDRPVEVEKLVYK